MRGAGRGLGLEPVHQGGFSRLVHKLEQQLLSINQGPFSLFTMKRFCN